MYLWKVKKMFQLAVFAGLLAGALAAPISKMVPLVQEGIFFLLFLLI
jgi:hypothetical protein